MGHIIFYSLWAVWFTVFMVTGWAEGDDAWFGALGAGFISTCVTMLIVMLVLGLFTGLALSLQDCFCWARDMRDSLRKRFG